MNNLSNLQKKLSRLISMLENYHNNNLNNYISIPKVNIYNYIDLLKQIQCDINNLITKNYKLHRNLSRLEANALKKINQLQLKIEELE